MSDTAAQSWIKREVSIGNLLLVLGTCGAIAAGIWEGGMIQATLADGISAEREARAAENRASDQRMTALASSVNDIRGDVRELRSYVMVKTQFQEPRR